MKTPKTTATVIALMLCGAWVGVANAMVCLAAPQSIVVGTKPVTIGACAITEEALTDQLSQVLVELGQNAGEAKNVLDGWQSAGLFVERPTEDNALRVIVDTGAGYRDMTPGREADGSGSPPGAPGFVNPSLFMPSAPPGGGGASPSR